MARIFGEAGKEALSKKSKPEVYFIMKSSNPEPELECLATGFYPGSINITLWKDKENMMDNVMVSETFPNGDGTYQERAIVTTGWEEQTTVYCKVEHISLEEPLVRQINMKHNAVTWIVIGAILGVVICVTGLIWFVKKRRRAYTSISGRTMDRIVWRTTDGKVSMQK
ncbi:RLA class I histocompatibility antigen, alpha chain 11/11-like isoform 1-T1 [Leptodactylus fuscus]|uniref:RLA class I histocompatibility antigen, alpha chain 11/11-like n=1 Tax=Leptodactylus fuscus TaxID=238119 RepID=UPI003F4E4CB0